MTTTAAPAVANTAVPASHAILHAINSKDLSRVSDCVTDDFIDHGSPVGVPPGPDGYIQILTFVTRVLSIRYEVLEEFATADRIVIRAVAHGVAVAPVHGEKFAGRPYTMPTLHVYRTEGDRLAEHWAVRDEYGVLVQIGALTPPGLEMPGLG